MGLYRNPTITIAAVALMLSSLHCKPRSPSDSAVRDNKSDRTGDSGLAATHVENASDWLPLDEETMTYLADYAWLNKQTNQREHHLEIWDKGLEMVGKAQKFVIFSVFLFDCMYSPTPPVRNMTGEMLDAIIKRKGEVPGLKVAVVLDPIHRAYVDRVAPAVKKLNDAGIDVFYTDLLVTPPAARTGIIQTLHKNGVLFEQLAKPQVKQILEEALNSEQLQSFPQVQNLTPVIEELLKGNPLVKDGKPVEIDGVPFNLELIYNIGLLKANHRKLLVTDDGDFTDALVGSSNPHNASYPAANSAIAFQGDLAAFVYNVVREDIGHSISKFMEWQSRANAPEALRNKYASRFVKWANPATAAQRAPDYLKSEFPALPVEVAQAKHSTVGKFVTESKIRDEIIAGLNEVGPDDEVRIQMFYLSNKLIIDAILSASRKTKSPVRLVLDPNKDAFNNIKDGTPNRQVATYLREQAAKTGGKIEIRWYDTHGEQNHAKVMSITNPQGKCWITTGSANWTGKNIGARTDVGSPNMESNLVVKGGQKLCNTFNALFEKFWSNEPGKTYTVDWNTPPYNQHTGMEKWTRGEATGLVAW